jgi:LuxR family quorum sensing-dependent transcriptional regulator
LSNSGRYVDFAGLQNALVDYADHIQDLRCPDDVLNELHSVTMQHLPLAVLGAARFPLKSGDWESIQLRKSCFLHRDAPAGWWEEYRAHARGRFRPLLFLAASSMASHTWTEARRMFQPIGIDQWTYELALKHGLRDGLTCPVGGRWVVVFWSAKDLSSIITGRMRIAIYAAASYAALRLEQLVDPDPSRLGGHDRLTPRELAVLRLVSTGMPFREVAKAIGLGEETVRSHLKKAQFKLGARNRTQAVAEALRQHLIP